MAKKKETTEKTHYSDQELQEFQDLIQAKLDSTRKELNILQEQIKKSNEQIWDGKLTGMEDGAGTSEKEHLNKMAARQAQYLQHLENAMIRIQSKTYGICRVTKKLIKRDRLLAVPHATLSIEAKNKMNK